MGMTMAELSQFESDPFLKLLTDALRAGPLRTTPASATSGSTRRAAVHHLATLDGAKLAASRTLRMSLIESSPPEGKIMPGRPNG